MRHSRVQFWLYALLFYTLLVILWGAWVRVSFSGDGCGTSWPLCHGQVIPKGADGKTWTELFHRITSGIYGLIVLGLFSWSHLSKKARDGLSSEFRFWTKLALFFTITEALLGAKIVLFGLVADNDSVFRSISMALHFMNSAILVACVCKCAFFAGAPQWQKRSLTDFERSLCRTSIWVLGFFFIMGATGTVAALSNTLYPADHLLQAIMEDFHPDSHFLVKLRGLHPSLGLIGGAVLLTYSWQLIDSQRDHRLYRNHAIFLLLIFTNILVGAFTILLKAPLILKIMHLVLAYGIWIWWLRLRHELKNTAQ